MLETPILKKKKYSQPKKSFTISYICNASKQCIVGGTEGATPPSEKCILFSNKLPGQTFSLSGNFWRASPLSALHKNLESFWRILQKLSGQIRKFSKESLSRNYPLKIAFFHIFQKWTIWPDNYTSLLPKKYFNK